MNELQPVMDLLGGNNGKLATVIAWIGALRLLATPFSAWVQTGFSKLLAQVQSTPEEDDDALVRQLLASWPYRLFAFLLDWLTSVKLPTTASLQKVTATETEQQRNTRAGLILLFGLTLGMFATTGASCPKASPQTVAYKSIYSVQKATVNSYEAYLDGVIAGQIATNHVPEVSRRFNQFQAATLAAASAAQWNTNAPASEQLARLSADFINLIQTVSRK